MDREIGVVIATHETPTPQEFHFVISESTIRDSIENGTFIQVDHMDEKILGVIQSLRRVNRYYSSADIIHGSSTSSALNTIYPADRWDYLIAKVKILGSYLNSIKQRSTKPVMPGVKVYSVSENILEEFLGMDANGMYLGKVKQSKVLAKINLDRILQKHLAILSISGGGKSYTTSVLIEELLRRQINQGRPCIVLFDVHGEYKGLKSITNNPVFENSEVVVYSGSDIKLALNNMSVGDFYKIIPSMSHAQGRELSLILKSLSAQQKPFTIDQIISNIQQREMNPLVKEALFGWMLQLQNSYLFSSTENPMLENEIQPGKLLIFDLSSFTSLWKKRIIVHYFLTRLFELRRTRVIPPIINFIEEAHQFCPEIESSESKSIIHTIAREGRKFLCSLVLISQRPINLSTTALSQCNSHLILRILNPHDLTYIGRTSEGINAETLGLISDLGVGEALLVGEAVNYPVFIQIRKKLFISNYDDTSLEKESRRYDKMLTLT
ncbi:MAG: ATP-binding protein [Candidatus Heimdallarchaeota archaeon]|nr:ATP-binding protein [Candidatus Heimdallarchaeota archaeon]MDH5644612.1 ATP-binding protein [Candidatus Heimdallarchaeota archaeon]